MIVINDASRRRRRLPTIRSCGGRAAAAGRNATGRMPSVRGVAARSSCCAKQLEGSKVTEDIHLVALVKGSERYVFLFAHARWVELLRLVARYAANPDLSFSWYDAAVISQKVRSLTDEDGDGISSGQ